MQPIICDSGRFTTTDGSEVLLHGVNMVCKDARDWPWTRADFAYLHAMGCNFVRLGLVWAYLEPEPGIVDSDYLDQARQCMDWAEQNGIRVLLDMHQDCYSYRLEAYRDSGSDSDALEWQAIADGLPHENPGSVWSDAYLTSPAVQRMFDNFWANRKAPDGAGLQDHYARSWQETVRVLGDHPALFGYDLMNEPSPGSDGQGVMARILARGAVALALRRGRFVTSTNELAELWMDAGQRREMTTLLANPRLFRRVIRAGRRRIARLERDLLVPFHERVAAAIRDVDANGIIATEPMTAEFMGNPSAARPPASAGSQAAYAPHLYDIAVDTHNESGFEQGRLELVARTHREDAGRWGVPLILGEWGAFLGSFGNDEMARAHAQLFDSMCCGEAYWCYDGPHSIGPDRRFARGTHRPVALEVPGRLVSHTTDLDAGQITVAWTPAPGATPGGSADRTALLYLPGRLDQSTGTAAEIVEESEFGCFVRGRASGPAGQASVTVSYGRTLNPPRDGDQPTTS